MENINDLQKLIDEFNQSELGKLTNKQIACADSGLLTKQSKLGIFADNNQSVGGQKSAKKQWSENREELLKRSKSGGDKCKELQKGIFTLTKENRSKQGKKGYKNGLGKLSKEELKKIAINAGKANRDKNSKLKPEDIKYIRQVFIPRHPEFGVVALSKKYDLKENAIRNIIKGRTYKDIV